MKAVCVCGMKWCKCGHVRCGRLWLLPAANGTVDCLVGTSAATEETHMTAVAVGAGTLASIVVEANFLGDRRSWGGLFRASPGSFDWPSRIKTALGV